MARKAASLSVTDGLVKMLDALRPALLPEHDGLVALATGLAVACTAEPENAALWREYRTTLIELLRVGEGASDSDTASFLVSVQAPVRPRIRHTAD